MLANICLGVLGVVMVPFTVYQWVLLFRAVRENVALPEPIVAPSPAAELVTP